MVKPKVSVICISYNQEKYIKDALEGFIKQRTKFDFEVLIGDDASTDQTPKIIKKYQDNYPEVIKPILREKNVGALPNFLDIFLRASGEYIAICEGDDYWTDINKLQLQVDFLDKNKHYAVCFHPVKVMYESQTKNPEIFPKGKHKFDYTELLKQNFIQTNSVMYRKQEDYKNLPTNIMPADWYMHLYHAQFGAIGFINKVMSVYRRHPGGIWWDNQQNVDRIWMKYGLEHLRMYKAILKLNFREQDKQVVWDNIYAMLLNLIRVDNNSKSKLIELTYAEMPDVMNYFVSRQNKNISDQQALINDRDALINELNKTTYDLKVKLADQEKLLDMIKSSRAWKARNQVAKLIGKQQIR